MIYRFDKRLGLPVALVLLAWFGCGPYSFSGSANPHIRTVAVPIFQDQTAEFGVKERLTEAVIEEFTRDNTLKIADRRNADSLVEGTILRVEDRAGAFTGDEQVSDVKVFVTVAVTYRDLMKRKVVWEGEITQWGTFDPDLGLESRDQGIAEALDKIANEILTRSVSGW